MPILARPGVDLYYETRGRGPPLLLVAGLGSDSQSWLSIAAALGERHRLILLDNRCAGRSAPQDVETSIDAMADDCVALLDALGVERAHVLGHSMGGFVAQRLATAQPGRVDRLVLAATSVRSGARNNALFTDLAAMYDAGTDRERWFRQLFCWIFTARAFDDRSFIDMALRWSIDYPFPQSARGFSRQVGALAAFDGSGDLARIVAPTLVLGGREDIVFPPTVLEALARSIPGAKTVMIDRAAHSIHSEQATSFVEAVTGFLAR